MSTNPHPYGTLDRRAHSNGYLDLCGCLSNDEALHAPLDDDNGPTDDLAAECERMRAVVEAAVAWEASLHTGGDEEATGRLIANIDAYLASAPIAAPPAATSEEGTSGE